MSAAYELAACPACGGTVAEEIAGEEAMRAELERLWSFHTRRLRAGTPPHHLIDRLAFSQRPPIRLARCTTCGTLYRNPRERDVADIYRSEPLTPALLRRLHDTQRPALRGTARRLRDRVGRGTRGLEVGSYSAAFLSAARDEGLRFEAIDVNDTAVAFAESLGFIANRWSIEEVTGDVKWDAVAILNCFDQLPDPTAAARHAHRLLRPGGALLIRVPNGAFYAALRSRLRGPVAAFAAAALACHNLLAFPYRTGFTATSLRMLLGRTGFHLDRVQGAGVLPGLNRDRRSWALLEERLVRGAGGLVPAGIAPWLEVTATRP